MSEHEFLNIDQDRYDHRLFNDLVDASTDMAALMNERSEGCWAGLLQDAWAAFYKAAPTLSPDEGLNAGAKATRPITEKLLEDPDTQLTRLHTSLDEMSAGVATLAAGNRLAQEIVNRPELQEAMKQADEAQEAQEEGTLEKAEELAQQANETLNKAAREVRRAVKAAIKAGQEEGEKVAAAIAGWGLEEADMKKLPLEKRIELAQQLSAGRLKKVAELVGRMRNLARGKQRNKVKHTREEIHGLEIGNDLGRVLPQELAALNHPLRKLDFFRKFTEGQLTQYEIRSNTPEGRGPIVALVDISGSMEGEPLTWAIAVAMALVDTASRQKRRAFVAFFDTKVRSEYEFEPGEKNPVKLAQMASTGCAGGTRFQPALQRAYEKVSEVNYKKADVLMITDGLCHLNDDFIEPFNKAKEQLGFTTYTVVLGYQPDENMKQWADKTWSAQTLDENIAGEIFEEVY